MGAIEGGTGGGGGGAPHDAGCEGTTPTSLDEVYAASLSASSLTGCATSGCHGTGAGGLTFSSARTLYDATVGRTAKSSTLKLVDPRDALGSELFVRLLPSAPSRMPQGGPYLDDAARAAVAGWICAGAPPPGTFLGDGGAGDGGVDAGVLTLTSFNPASGVVGTRVTLTGDGFAAAGLTVTLSGVLAPIVSTTATTLVLRVPTAAITGPFRVSAGGRMALSATDFVVEQGNPVPSIDLLTPATAVVGVPQLDVVASGSGFIDGGVVLLDGSPLPSQVTSGTSLRFTLPGSVLATAGLRQVTVSNPGPGGGVSSPAAFSVLNPTPTLAGAAPMALITNGAPTLVRLTGTGFLAQSQVRVDGAGVGATFINATTLDVQIPTVTVDGAHPVTVTNPVPGGGTSAPVNLTATTVVTPVITGLTPSPAPALLAFTLSVSGANFTCSGTGPRVLLDASTLTPASCTATQLSVSVASTAAGTSSVQVRNPNGDLSNTVALSVVTPNPVPQVTSLSPASFNAGGTGATLVVSGSSFVSGAQVTFNGATRVTTFTSATSLSAALTQTDLATAGNFSIGVTNPAPGGGASNTLPLSVVMVNPAPVLSAVTPSSFVTGASTTSVSATGSGFVANSVVNFNGSARTTTFVSPTQLSFTLTATDLGTAGTWPVTVTSPGPGGGTSSSVSLSVGSPVPVLTAVSPCGAVANTAHTLTVMGSGFVSMSTVRFNGTALVTTLVSPTQLSAALPASAIATAPGLGSASTVTVVTAAPGGGTSAGVTFGVAKNNSTLSANVQPVFTASCATMGCHSGATPAQGLLLTAGQSLASLVGAASTQCVGKVRVVACNPTRAVSVLADKILASGTSPACAGTPMPKMAPLTAAEKQALIDWIALGAPP